MQASFEQLNMGVELPAHSRVWKRLAAFNEVFSVNRPSNSNGFFANNNQQLQQTRWQNNAVRVVHDHRENRPLVENNSNGNESFHNAEEGNNYNNYNQGSNNQGGNNNQGGDNNTNWEQHVLRSKNSRNKVPSAISMYYKYLSTVKSNAYLKTSQKTFQIAI